MTSSSDGLTAPFALVRFRAGDAEPVLGLVAGERVREIGPDELGAPDLNAFLAKAPASWERLRSVAEQADASWQPLAEVILTAPVTPRQVLQTGANYRTHVIDLVARREQRLQKHATTGRDHFVRLKCDHSVFCNHRLQFS